MIQIKKIENLQELENNIQNNPFTTNWYLKVFSNHFCKKENVIFLGIFQSDEYVGYGAFEKINNNILFLGMNHVLGSQEVSDYGDIVFIDNTKQNVEEIWKEIIEWFKKNGYKTIQLDYVREDSGLHTLFKEKAVRQATAPNISLGISWEDYLESLDRVDRKELKRKLRRLETVSFTLLKEDCIRENFEEFIRLHKLSSLLKNSFMSDEMKAYFWDLTQEKKDPWEMHIYFLQINNVNTAGLLTIENSETIFGYNSGYDPGFNYYSTGLLLHALIIKKAIEDRKNTYDFLRGEERYKFDLGGKPLALYQIVLEL